MPGLKVKVPKDEIIGFFDALPKKIFDRRQIEKILVDNRWSWRLRPSTTYADFVDFLMRAKLQRLKFEFPGRNVLRYTWGEVPYFEVVNSLKPESYFTHFTAMYLHGLTEQVPKTIYLNYEQPRKQKGDPNLEQSRIDAAFKRQVRISKTVATQGDHRICLLNGLFTGQAGVEDFIGPDGANIRVTNIERTLIDATVRPTYAGGVFEVLKAYQRAKGKASVNTLAALLKKINYVYPYHQAIGFYLEKSGVYNESAIRLFQDFDIKYDFYLMHQIKDASYDDKWRLFFPKGL